MRWTPSILILLAAAWGAPAGSQGAPTIDDAHKAYYLGQYRESLRLYEHLAAANNAEAAERAAFMLLQADALYGRQVQRDIARAKALLIQAARAGRAGAGFMLNMLEYPD